MKTGVIIEIKNGKAVLMQNGGAFISVPAGEGWRQGDVVSIKSPGFRLRPLLALAACFAILLGLGGGGFRLYFTQTALVSVDVNPSIEMSLNRFDRVISAKALNREGEDVLAETAWKNRPYGRALESILNEEGKKGYFNQNTNVVVTVYSANGKKRSALLDGAQKTADEALAAHHVGTKAEVHAVDEGAVEEAHGCGVTAGKYIYLRQLQELSPDIDVEDYADNSIGQIKEQIEECQNEHGPKSEGAGGGYGAGDGGGKEQTPGAGSHLEKPDHDSGGGGGGEHGQPSSAVKEHDH